MPGREEQLAIEKTYNVILLKTYIQMRNSDVIMYCTCAHSMHLANILRELEKYLFPSQTDVMDSKSASDLIWRLI